MLRLLYYRILPASVRRFLHPVLHPRVAYVEWRARRFASGTVQFGPFKGMRLADANKTPLPVLLGTYEREFHPAYAHLRNKRFTHVLDIGGGVGYYAVGTALWQADAVAVCWESDKSYHPIDEV